MAFMAQILIRQLDDDTKAKLQRMARKHGRSTEEEVRDILRNAVRDVDESPSRLGSRIAARFSRLPLSGDIPELRGNPVRPAQFDS
jgi:antitoxin FitA